MLNIQIDNILYKIREEYVNTSFEYIIWVIIILVLLINYWKIYLMIVGYFVLYWMPTYIAFQLKWKADLVFVINLFFGWIVIWILW